MYLGLVLIVLAILFAVAGIFSGGTFTIVLVPLAAVAVVGALSALLSARAAGITGSLTEQPKVPAKGRDSGPPAGQVSATPDELTDARQRHQ